MTGIPAEQAPSPVLGALPRPVHELLAAILEALDVPLAAPAAVEPTLAAA